MSVNAPADRPPMDPHPLSPYVTWAGIETGIPS